MPQFPFEPDRKHSNPLGNYSGKIVEPPAATIVEPTKKAVSPKEPVEPIKFRTSGELKGPVTRVKLDPSDRPRSKKKSPFRDRGLLDDTDSLVQLRNSFGKPIVYTLLAVALVYLIYMFSRPSNEAAKAEEELRPLVTQANHMLADSDIDNKDNLKKRIAFADRLQKYRSSQEATDLSSELKLRSLTTLDAINLANQLETGETKSQMETQSRASINSQNKTVANLAKVGLMQVRVHSYLDTPNKRFFPELLDQFKLVSSFAREDLSTARNLLRVATAFESRQLIEESNQLFRAVNLTCSASPNQNIAAVANEARGKLATTTTLFADLKKMISTGEKIEIAAVSTKINGSLSKDTISVSAVEAVLDFFELLVQRNAVNALNVLMPDVSKAIYDLPGGIERDAVRERFDGTKKRLAQVGEVFQFNGLYSIEGRPISRTNFDKQRKMILFWSPDNSKSLDLLQRISVKAEEFAKQRVKIIAITTIEDNQASRNRVVDIANEHGGIEFYTLIKGRMPSQAFASRFPLPKIPYWLLLTEDDRPRALNVPPGIIDVQDMY